MTQADNIFKKCLTVGVKYDINVQVGAFNQMIHVYARNNDYDSCRVLLKYMIDTEKKHKVIPMPVLKTFEQIIKPLVVLENNDDKRMKIDDICKIMDDLKIGKGTQFYCSLLEACDDDIERAKKFYNEIINDNYGSLKMLV